jgi:molybdopterin adenylyltransferase
MSRIDESLPFKPVRIAILTVSDTRTPKDDKSGSLLTEMLAADGHELAGRAIVRDDVEQIRAQLRVWIADPAVDAVVTTGGTGLTGRDVTPEAVRPLFEKEIDGFSVLMHMLSYATIGTSTIQSRALAGVAGGTYIFCVPGSPGACKDAWTMILRFQFDSRHRPCNFIEIMPRLMEHAEPQR